MRPASLGRVTVAKYPERTDATQVCFWRDFGAGHPCEADAPFAHTPRQVIFEADFSQLDR